MAANKAAIRGDAYQINQFLKSMGVEESYIVQTCDATKA